MNTSRVIFDISSKYRRRRCVEEKAIGQKLRDPAVEYDCACCGKGSFETKSCTRCWSARYCDRECQRKHWAVHRLTCVSDPDRRGYYRGGRVVEFNYANESGRSGAGSEPCDAGGADDSCVAGDLSYEAGMTKLYLGLDDCPKNGHNKHADFIPVREFSAGHLPPYLRLDEVSDYIRAEACLTVRILVRWTSKNRPLGDPCYRQRDTKNSRTASGTFIMDRPDEFRRVPCPVANCHRKSDLGGAHDVWCGELKVFTNKHVLYDDDEMRATCVDFFYDSEDRVGVVREYATKLYYNKRSTDRAFFLATVHDQDFLSTLQQLEVTRGDTFRKIPHAVLAIMPAFAIVISHPHGMSKKVSVGKVVKVSEENITEQTVVNARLVGTLEKKWFLTRSREDYLEYITALGTLDMPMYKVWYDTPTCSGSSGAPVLFGAREVNGTWGPNMAFHTAYEPDQNLNFFKVGRFILD